MSSLDPKDTDTVETADTPSPGSGSNSSLETQPKVFVKSYGCQMNVYDSTRILDTLNAKGYGEATDEQDADLVILNTCHIRERATHKVYSELGKLRILKQERAEKQRPLKLIVAGCIAQAEGAEIIRQQPAVDAVIGPQNYHKIGDLVDRPIPRRGIVDTEFPIESKFDHLPPPSRDRANQRGVSAFVTVQEGCDKFCTFCVVPYTRGAEVSRPVKSILEEVSDLVTAQVREITLIGQNVNAYHGDSNNGQSATLAKLLSEMADIPGVERLRYTTSHPRDMSDDLIEAHGNQPKLMPYLHLPVQSGSDKVLAEMNRKHTAAEYIDIVRRVRQQRPDIAMSSDFIVGFPGESEEDFRDTLRLVEQVKFASAYSFKYSPRPGTTGNELDDDVSQDIKSRRLSELQCLLDEQRRQFNQACVGKVLPVLFEKPGRHPGQIVGKTPYLQSVQVDGDMAKIGTSVPVLITEAGSNSFFGELAVQC